MAYRPALRRIRALKMLEMLISGNSRKEIAQQFRVSPRTVHNEVDFLEREGLLQQTEESILKDLQPLAVKVMKKHLTAQEQMANPDAKAAQAVLREAMKRAATPKPQQSDEMTLEKWVIERKVTKVPAAPPVAALDGEIVHVGIDRPAGSPPGILSADPQGQRGSLPSADGDQREDGGSVRDE